MVSGKSEANTINMTELHIKELKGGKELKTLAFVRRVAPLALIASWPPTGGARSYCHKHVCRPKSRCQQLPSSPTELLPRNEYRNKERDYKSVTRKYK